MFVDEVSITVTGGRGGDGSVSFRHEKYVPRGGPDGGDGGKGGAVIIIAQEGLTTLLDVAKRREYQAENGKAGTGKKRGGRSGKDIVIRVPCGTLIKNAATGDVMRDLKVHDESVVIAKGGRGGHGNVYYASATNQTPRQAQSGREGESREIALELKLLADVGLVGLPNAGKSTLLSRLSSARPKIADYPFTTKTPHLGIVELEEYRRFIMADIPGLIEGAHKGTGLGDEFLKHIERTRVIVHLIEIAPTGGPAPHEAYRIIRNELASYSEALAEKPEIVVASKMDLCDSEEPLDELRRNLGIEIVGISAATGRNLQQLLIKIAEILWPADE